MVLVVVAFVLACLGFVCWLGFFWEESSEIRKTHTFSKYCVKIHADLYTKNTKFTTGYHTCLGLC